MNINTVAISGNLTKAPDLHTSGSGKPVCKMRVAVNERVKVGEEWQSRANYFDVVTFGKTAENANRYLDRGSGVAVAGRLHWHEWTQDDGTKRQSVEIVADVLQFIGAKAEKPAEVAFETADDIPF